MAKYSKLTKSEKKKITSFEKDTKEDKKLWHSIEKIHKTDEGIFSFLGRFFKRKPAKSQKKASKKR